MIEITKKLVFVIIIGLVLLLIALFVSGFLTLSISEKILEEGKDILIIRPLK